MADIISKYTKTKKVKPKAKVPGNIRIVDDDVTVRDVMPETFANTIEDDLYKDEPVVAEIIDERPEIVKKLEEYSNSKWKRIVVDDGDDDDEIKVYEALMAHKAATGGGARAGVIDDDDLDMVRIKKENSDYDAKMHKKIKKEKKDREKVKVKTEEEEVDETKVRVRKPTLEETLEKARKEERKAQYAEWGKGIVQKKLREEQLESDLYEAEKPLARYIDDQDLDKLLRDKELEDDPMLQYIRKDKEGGDGEKKVYRGPAPAPNRFNIRPGYRWDGVDRSNGFEKKYYLSLANKKAVQYEKYKWSVEDM